MKKKKYEEELSETTSSFDVVIEKKITKLDVDFGRGDLNLMRDKINEVIEHVSKSI